MVAQMPAAHCSSALDAGVRITTCDSRETQKRNCKLSGPQAPKACNLKCRRARKIDSRSVGLGGRWMDNVFIERLWRSLKHEDIYLKGYADGREAKAGIANWIAFYNGRRLHQALGYRTPMAVWHERMQAAKDVDMMDNADALTTCPQQQQQTASLAA
jgi:hypothetical protein